MTVGVGGSVKTGKVIKKNMTVGGGDKTRLEQAGKGMRGRNKTASPRSTKKRGTLVTTPGRMSPALRGISPSQRCSPNTSRVTRARRRVDETDNQSLLSVPQIVVH